MTLTPEAKATDGLASMIAKPLSVQGHIITRDEVRRIIDQLANIPQAFKAIDLIGVTPQHGDKPVWFAQEVLNRLFQRWRKLGLVGFSNGRWFMPKRAWDQFQAGCRYREDVR